MNLASTALTLFLVLDPFGNMPVFQGVLARVPEEKRLQVLLRELLIAFGILLLFLFAGSAILNTLGIRPSTLSISGGILLFLIALGMVFPAKSLLHEAEGEEPFIVPLAVPLMAGPSAIALLLLLASKYPHEKAAAALAVTIAWAGSAAVLLVAPWLMRLLGNKGARALERLMGMLLILIAVQMFLDGLQSGGYPIPPPHIP